MGQIRWFLPPDWSAPSEVWTHRTEGVNFSKQLKYRTQRKYVSPISLTQSHILLNKILTKILLNLKCPRFMKILLCYYFY